MNKTYIYILIMTISVFLIRAIPILIIKKTIKNSFIRSFLYYVPYVTLALMVFPSMIEVTTYKIAGIASLIVGIILGYQNYSLFKITIACCLTVYIIEFIIKLF